MESASRQPRAQMAKHEAERLAEEDAQRAAVQEDGERDGTEIIEDIDDLLADIDALLEEQSVLTHFRQKGGE